MYKRILVPLEHSDYDAAILEHVSALAHFCGASVVLIHVADGWAARNLKQLNLRESEEMRLDREYIEAQCAALTASGLRADCHSCRRRSVQGDRRRRGARIVRPDRDVHARAPLHQGHHLRQRGERGTAPVARSRPARARRAPHAARQSRHFAARAAGMSAVRATQSLTAPVEDYLKVIFELESAGEPAGTNEIAAELGVAPASVSGMVRRLVGQRLITHERYRGVRLTRDGRRAALRTIRRHRVIEAYLTQALHYPWDLVHDEAERLEHAASDELIDRMAAAIGEPTTDPHGAPIPTREGTLRERTLTSLNEIEEGRRVRVERVGDRDPGQLRYLAELGIIPGTRVEVESRAPYDGPIKLRVGGGKAARSIGPALARQIFVSRAESR